MSYGDNQPFQHLKLPITWGVMVVVAAICVVGALMFLGDRRGGLDAASYGNRAGFDRAAAKGNNLLTGPAHFVSDRTNGIEDYFFAVSENRVLKQKIVELEKYRDAYRQAKELNRRYEVLLNLRTEPEVESVTARSVSVSRGPFNNNRLIDAGVTKGLAFGNPVINEHGLVGRVVGVSPDVSRILMVTDVVSRVPVMVTRTDARAMMVGDGGGFPRLEFVRGGPDVLKKGDQILTSGDGGIFPRGLPVGEARRGVDGVWRVDLYTNRGPIDLVKVLKFQDFTHFPRADEVLRSPLATEVLPPPTPTAPTAATSASVSSQSATSASATTAAAPRPRPTPVPAAPRPQTTPAAEAPASAASASGG
ncbi:rod shape-determining protein MreC [Asticcacaulis sp. AND118]|uniref:rod shape-determining protein MreC n=1 Tax=Asticcacaulis sp. AND118 TaxID=2840468 RepID=UPI001CFFE600|nr:rod shape-determining protein MreC [Asticcacaulis sp. AND118]UDF02737.1 rod shape-determining protein MreC [Asticcacaulis sp. AND118]